MLNYRTLAMLASDSFTAATNRDDLLDALLDGGASWKDTVDLLGFGTLTSERLTCICAVRFSCCRTRAIVTDFHMAKLFNFRILKKRQKRELL